MATDTATHDTAPAGALDLVMTRVVDVPRERIWKAWTDPALLPKWFCPKPWSASVLEMDVRPGGAFRTVMHSPDGTDMPEGNGCYLEVVENERLSFTSALTAGFRPAEPPVSVDDCHAFHMTAIITLEAVGEGSTRYTARALHSSEANRDKHAAMGFHEGWSTCLDQLVAMVKQGGAEGGVGVRDH